MAKFTLTHINAYMLSHDKTPLMHLVTAQNSVIALFCIIGRVDYPGCQFLAPLSEPERLPVFSLSSFWQLRQQLRTASTDVIIFLFLLYEILRFSVF